MRYLVRVSIALLLMAKLAVSQTEPSENSESEEYDYYDDYSPRQADLGLSDNVPKCGERSFTPLQNRERNQASPGEFPWMCLVLGKDEFGGWDKGGHFLCDVLV